MSDRSCCIRLQHKKYFKVHFQYRPQSILGDTIYSCYYKLRLVTPMVGAEGTKIFDFDNPRSLEKALSGKKLHRKLLLLTKKHYKYWNYFSRMLKKYYLADFFGRPYHTNGIKTRRGSPVTLFSAICYDLIETKDKVYQTRRSQSRIKFLLHDQCNTSV